MYRNKIRLIAVLAIVLCGPGQARSGFITNGDFSSTTGYGQFGSSNYSSGPTVTGWASTGYSFIFNQANAQSGVSGQDGGLALWGSTNGGVANGSGQYLTASPAGTNFIGADGAYLVQPITQTISSLVIGQSYQLGFWWAGAQQTGYTGNTTDQWQVTLGGVTQDTKFVSNNSKSFTGWMYQTFDYVATSSSETLSFLANGTPGSGEPPFSLLAGVTLNSVPEPSSVLMLGIGLAGFVIVGRRRNRRARSLPA